VGNGATTYEWTLPAGLTGSSTTRTITITGATAGTYNAKSISVKATNDCGYITATGSGGAITVRDCSAAPAKPTLNITATTINRTGTTTLECTDVSNGATAYEWTLPSGLTGSSTTNTITVTGSTVGTYAAGTITVTATNDCGNTPATGSGGAITVNLVCPSSVTDSQGHEYSIGNFGSVGCWMTQNLRSTSGLTANLNAGNATNQKYYWYPNSSQSTFNSNPTYGLLYTWTAASGRAEADTDSNGVGITPGQEDHKGICPDGWHLPSDYEWNQLEEEIAKSAVNVYSTTAATTWESGYSTTLGYRGTHGQKMKSTTPVNSQATNGTSQSMTENGFDALLVGFMLGGSPLHYGAYTYFWSSSSGVSSSAWRRYLYRSDTGVYCSYNSKYCMYSVRCKKNDN
jgi:uncharacterized protein (TIGR02145 family)